MPAGQTCSACRQVPLPSPFYPLPTVSFPVISIGDAKSYAFSRSPATTLPPHPPSPSQRCDGIQPMCGPCSKARKPITCEYTSTTAVANVPKGEYLKKGAACAPCRYAFPLLTSLAFHSILPASPLGARKRSVSCIPCSPRPHLDPDNVPRNATRNAPTALHAKSPTRRRSAPTMRTWSEL